MSNSVIFDSAYGRAFGYYAHAPCDISSFCLYIIFDSNSIYDFISNVRYKLLSRTVFSWPYGHVELTIMDGNFSTNTPSKLILLFVSIVSFQMT